VSADETGWRVSGRSAWPWVATTNQVTAYNIAWGRGFDQACELLDATFAGTLVRDGWAPYRSYTAATHQSCAYHLLHRCHELISGGVPSYARYVPRQVKDLLQEGLDARDLDDPAQRAAVVADLTERVELLAGQAQPHDECRRLVGHLYRERHALFTYLTIPGVDAANWRAEQAIRPAVVNRKISAGNRSPRGAQTQSRMMTVFRTASQQGIDVIDYLTRLARAPNPATTGFFT
jgi:transposase